MKLKELLNKYENALDFYLTMCETTMAPFLNVVGKFSKKTTEIALSRIDVVDKNLSNLENKLLELVKVERKYKLDYLLK